MDKATEHGEPLAYDCADRMEAQGISPLDAGRKLVAVGLSRVRSAITDKHELAEELAYIIGILDEEIEELLKSATH